jgi:L,D-peptidoglycan transpeptidase YkuD (ErfK/YbiS/YcfS/YnhG family)
VSGRTLTVAADRPGGTAGWLEAGCRSGRRHRCALGRTGIARDKREGDGATPAGLFPLRRVLYRPDRMSPPRTALAAVPLRPADGWCDDPADAAYNRPVTLPYAGGHERLWRDDRLYDLILVIGHNDDPVLAGAGSAVFVHVAAAGWEPTAGCVALALPDLLTVLAGCGPGDALHIQAG